MNLEKLKIFILEKLTTCLSEKLTYHGVHHTSEVLNNCIKYIERLRIQGKDAELLQTAALMHDTGFLNTYENHEEESKQLTRDLLPDWGYSSDDIEIICGMIEATKIPQKPLNILEKIIADSDLDYLGTDAFYEISDTLYIELLAHNKIKNRKDWNKLQIKFLRNHKFHTEFAQKFREPLKQKHLKHLVASQK